MPLQLQYRRRQESSLGLNWARHARSFRINLFWSVEDASLWAAYSDGFGQHLAQFGLGFRRFALGRLPLGHNQHLGMPEGDLAAMKGCQTPCAVNFIGINWYSHSVIICNDYEFDVFRLACRLRCR